MKHRIIMLALLVPLGSAHGADFCTSNSTELQDALTQSQFNGVDDKIMLTTTSIFSAPASGFTYDADAVPQAVDIEGGYTAGCDGKSGQSKSIIDLSGVTVTQGLGLEPSQGSLRIANVALRFKPHSGNGNGNALNISGANAFVTVEGSAFYSNAGNGGSALCIRGNGISTLIRDNVFAGNNSKNGTVAITGGTVTGQDAADCVVENNTIFENNGLQAGDATGLLISDCLSSAVSNNIIHSNEGTDLQILSAAVGAQKSAELHSNDIEEKFISSVVALTESSTLNIAPNLGPDPFKMQPPSGSALIDAGAQPLLPNAFDFRGKPRRAGGAVDIGAFEVQTTIFADGFESVL